MCQPQRLIGILLHQQHRQTLVPIQLPDRAEDLPHHQGGQAQTRLIQQQQLRLAHERPADRQHLLFPARQRAAALGQPLLQAGKQMEDLIPGPLVMLHSHHLRTHQQVLMHGHAGKDAAPLRGLGHAPVHDLVRR